MANYVITPSNWDTKEISQIVLPSNWKDVPEIINCVNLCLTKALKEVKVSNTYLTVNSPQVMYDKEHKFFWEEDVSKKEFGTSIIRIYSSTLSPVKITIV